MAEQASLCFLTKDVAERACAQVEMTIKQGGPVFGYLKDRMHLHIVILVPSILIDEHGSFPHKFTTSVKLLHEHSVGSPGKWEHPYDEIAQRKAWQLWEGRNNGSSCVQPQLLFTGDTPFWGGVDRGGIVVACSGDQQHFDQMISGMVADMCIALANNAFEEFKKNTGGKESFIYV